MKTRIFGFLLFLFIAAAAPVSMSADAWNVLVEKGDQASERKDYETALTFYLPAARQGHPFAMNAAGSAYLNKGDARRAYLWCTIAGLKFEHATDFGCLHETESRISPDEVKRIYQLAVQCLASQYKSCERLDSSQQANIATYHATKCRVADPTGSQLNLRTTPNGRIITTIENDISITIIDAAKDHLGREWVYIERDESGMALGWAFKRFLKCGPRHNFELAANQEEAPPPPATPPTLGNIIEIFPTSKRSPSNERVEKAFDGDRNTKYLNFDKLNAGFIVRFSQPTTLVSIRLTTANDFPGRDPTSMTINGSSDGRNWRSIVANMPVALPGARKTVGPVMEIPLADRFEYFQIIFPTVKNMSRSCGLDCDSVQIADVEMIWN